MSEINQGKVVQVMGAVVDVKFDDHLPAILDALQVEQDGKKLVLEDVVPDQVRRFPGERKILRKYLSLGSLARALYLPDGRLNQMVARDFGSVHHLRESISFYCRPLLGVLTPVYILVVVCQETLAADCKRLLGVDITGVRERSNESKRRIDQDLDATALNNLKRFLVEDYQCLAALWSYGALSDQQFWRVMTSSVEGTLPSVF